MTPNELANLLSDFNKAELILDNMANKFDLDQLPTDIYKASESAWKATQEARRLLENHIKKDFN